MKYPIGAESLAKFCRVKVNVSDKIVRDYRKSFPEDKSKSFAVDIADIRVIDSRGLIPMVIIERPNDADRALAALKLRPMNGPSTQKSSAMKPKRSINKPSKQAKPKQAIGKKAQPKKQKPSRPLFVLPKWNKTEHSKKHWMTDNNQNQIGRRATSIVCESYIKFVNLIEFQSSRSHSSIWTSSWIVACLRHFHVYFVTSFSLCRCLNRLNIILWIITINSIFVRFNINRQDNLHMFLR